MTTWVTHLWMIATYEWGPPVSRRDVRSLEIGTQEVKAAPQKDSNATQLLREPHNSAPENELASHENVGFSGLKQCLWILGGECNAGGAQD